MPSFLVAFAAAFTAILLGASGITHLIRFGSFRSVLRSHGTIPPVLTTPFALLVTLSELALAASAASVFLGEEAHARSIFALAAICGGVFAVYLRILLRHPGGVTSCGCSPFESPLSPLSLAPALSLCIIASAAWLFAGPGHDFRDAFATFMGVVWGITIALLSMLVPATLQEPARESSL